MSHDTPTAPTRRTFLGASAGAALLGPLASSAARPRPVRAKKILVIGGTRFLGPAFVEAALDAGHELTLFNRGRSNPHLFPDVERLTGNRRRPMREGDPEQDLSALEGRKWDAVVDTAGYFTRNVEDSARLLADAVDQYVFISSLSVYRDIEQNTEELREDSPLATCDDKYVLSMGEDFANYGPLKAYCEQAVEQFLPGRATAVRPGYIVGPRDQSGRFCYWPERFARGGEVLAPGDPDQELQFIDVRDLGAWLVRVCEDGLTGAYNADGFRGRISTAEFLYTGKGTLNHECRFTWVDDAFLVEQKVTGWGEMPAWTPKAKLNHAAVDKAIAAGLTFRPIAETIRDTWQWMQEDPPQRPAGMKAEREAALLAAWRARGK